MSKILRFPLITGLLAVLLLAFVVIHEGGQTLAARLLGDPNATFYFARIDSQGTCLGCNITDYSKLTKAGNLLVSLAGLAATQVVGWGLMLAAFWRRAPGGVSRWLAGTGFVYILADSIAQGMQGLLYSLDNASWPTNVDLLDAQLLIREFSGLGAPALKLGLAVLIGVNITGAVMAYRRIRSGL